MDGLTNSHGNIMEPEKNDMCGGFGHDSCQSAGEYWVEEVHHSVSGHETSWDCGRERHSVFTSCRVFCPNSAVEAGVNVWL